METIPRFFTGGCVCGAIRYECASRPLAMLNCHCRDCQQVSGGPYTPVVYVPTKAFRLTKGTLHYFSTPSVASGHNKRSFCPDCGSRITGAETERGMGITASSLDDPSWFRPTMNIWVSDAQPWDVLDPALPKFEQYPPLK
jgi:hypothetical protein